MYSQQLVTAGLSSQAEVLGDVATVSGFCRSACRLHECGRRGGRRLDGRLRGPRQLSARRTRQQERLVEHELLNGGMDGRVVE